jgi:hypothetical protein
MLSPRRRMRQFELQRRVKAPNAFFFRRTGGRQFETVHLQHLSKDPPVPVVDDSQMLIGLSQPGAPSVAASHTAFFRQRQTVTTLL